jgi:transposase
MGHKRYRPWTPEQGWLLPPSPRDWLPDDHLVHFVMELVSSLDLSEIDRKLQSKDARGERPFDPRMMVALLLYGYATGTYSSRRLARATYEDVAVRYLTGDAHPHFTVIAGFRRRHKEALGRLFLQVLKLCGEAGLCSLGHVSLDGTKLRANASKHSAMSYGRMKQEEERLKKEIEELLRRGEETDVREDAEQGTGRDAASLPDELRRREARLARIQQAKEALEREARDARKAALLEQAEAALDKADTCEEQAERKRNLTRARQRKEQAQVLAADGDESDPSNEDDHGDGIPRHKVQHTPAGEPKDRAQRNFTDPDSRIMVSDGAFVQAYNAQAVVDGDHQVIVSQSLSNQPPDTEYLRPMLLLVEQNLGRRPKILTADSGYFSEENARFCQDQGVDAYIATGRTKHGTGSACGPPPPQEGSDEPAAIDSAREIMRKKLRTPEGEAHYRRRKTIPEPVFGQIKAARGFRSFLLRGMDNVRHEWAMVCTAHNLLKLFAARKTVLAVA